LSGQSSGLFLQTDYHHVLLLSVSHLIFNLGTPRFILCPHLYLSFVCLDAPLFGSSHTSLPSITLTNLHTKLEVYLLAQILVIFPPTVYHGHVLLFLLLANEQLFWSVSHINTSWNMSKRAWVRVWRTQHLPPTHTCTLSLSLSLSLSLCGLSGN
jgi:hypothetical protein